ncbi:hypothetical protein M0811_08635 [Anaeramoeba ignava]|uniref:BTB/POZ domain-containing protein n=1 Tax=Anaeramoeba ignava TaxID=1746090 RepID=A0A9Q0LIP2_ANAIG|nr:hypothetical protein M0811_08635 [Anaeramoeba ignava]
MFISENIKKQTNQKPDLKEGEKEIHNWKTLSTNYKQLFSPSNEFSDFQVIVTSPSNNLNYFNCHKCILASRNEYFQGLLRSGMKESIESKVIINGILPSIMEIILEYIYSGSMKISLENALEVLDAAKRFLLDKQIVREINSFISENINSENVCQIMDFAEQKQLNDMQKRCSKFIQKNLKKMCENESILNLSEDLFKKLLNEEIQAIFITEFELFKVIIKWAQKRLNLPFGMEFIDQENSEMIKKEIQDLIHGVRFISMTQEELQQISSLKIIPDEYMVPILQSKQNKQTDSNQNFTDLIKDSKILTPRNYGVKESDILSKNPGWLKFLDHWIKTPGFVSQMKLGYSGVKHGFAIPTFHSKCDNRGQTLVLIETNKNFIFGGFTSVGWVSDPSKWVRYRHPGYIKDSKAFIFSLKKGDKKRTPKRFRVIKKRSVFAIHYNDNILLFGKGGGNADIRLLWNGSILLNYSNFGHTYHLPPDMKVDTVVAQSYLAGEFQWDVKNIEVFFN